MAIVTAVRFSTAVALLLACSNTALAQADENVVTQAEDAFGLRIGNENIGLYSEDEVRGFNLEAAGNYRINGAYYVRDAGMTDRVLGGAAIKVGINALNFDFPAPSGVVDYQLRRAVRNGVDVTFGLGDYASPYIEADAMWRSADGRVGVASGIGFYRDSNLEGANQRFNSFGFIPEVKLTENITATGVISHIDFEEDASVAYTTDGRSLPPRLTRRRYQSQEWAESKGRDDVAGLILRGDWSNGWGGQASVFFSEWNPSQSFFHLFSDVQADGTARSLLIASPEHRYTSWSSELRVDRQWRQGALSHKVVLALRGRRSDARTGGDQVIDLGSVNVLEPQADMAPIKPTFSEGRDRDSVRQVTGGVSYQLSWDGVGQLSLGLLKTHYEKKLRPAGGLANAESSSPWLYNAALVVPVSPRLSVYGTYTRGLEELGSAPEHAANRNAVLPPGMSSQREIGLRYAVTPKLTAILAGFDTRKPYAGLRSDQVYTSIGTVRHRGVEASLAGTVIDGLTIVAGGLFMEPELKGADVEAGLVAKQAAGSVGRQINFSVNYDVAWVEGLALDVNLTHLGRRAASSQRVSAENGDNAAYIPARDFWTAGARYRMLVGKVPVTARAQIINIFNNYGLRSGSSELFGYNRPRTGRLIFTAEL